MTTKVSIILPTHNGSKTIEKSIRSVIAQSFQDWELLIIDDGSTDNIKSILAPFTKEESRIFYARNEFNLGIQKSLNLGLNLAKGEYIARIDDDDEWTDEDKLRKQVEFLDSNQDHVLVGTCANVIDERGVKISEYVLPEGDEEIRNKLLYKNCFIHSSVVYRRDQTLSLGGYDEGEETKHVEDYHLWLLLGQKGRLANLGDRMINFRRSSSSISSKNKLHQLKKDLFLIKMFKGLYPNYRKSLFLRIIIVIFYRIFDSIVPDKFKNFLIRKYKSF